MDFFTSLYQLNDLGILVLRIVLGVIFLVHGISKFAMWKMQPSEQMPKNMLTMMRFLSIVESLGGLAVLAGFLTQFAALGLGVIMIGALVFKIGIWKAPFTAQDKLGWEYDLILLAVSFALFISGPGSLSVDRIFFGL
ncbi:DoxX family protein [Patescibacteria group bacterium]|nr:DoxX family protein [Patescibacteria group bacterium]